MTEIDLERETRDRRLGMRTSSARMESTLCGPSAKHRILVEAQAKAVCSSELTLSASRWPRPDHSEEDDRATAGFMLSTPK